MIFREPKNLRDAMSPVIRTCWIFGIGIFEYPLGHPRPVLSLIWSITQFLTYSSTASFAQVPEFNIVKESAVANHNYMLSSFCCTIFIITSMIVVRKTKIITRCDERIDLINESLKKFGVPKDYGITFKYQLMQLGVSFAQMTIISIICFFAVGNEDSYTQIPNIVFWCSAHFQLIFMFMVGCTYCGYIRYIGNRFQHLNSCLLHSATGGRDTEPFFQDLDKRISTVLPTTFEIHGDLRLARVASRRWTVHVLREMRSIHHDLCVVAEQLNRAFGMPIIFFMGISFCTITSLLFSIYLSYAVPSSTDTSFPLSNIIPGSCWLIPYAMAVHYVIYCSTMVSSEAQKTGQVIHELVKSDITSDIQSEINVFSLQLMQNPLEFTANGFFTLDYTLIRGMAGSVTTYLVIMVQMRSIYDPPSDLTTVSISLANSTS